MYPRSYSELEKGRHVWRPNALLPTNKSDYRMWKLRCIVCLSHWNFHLYGNVTITSEALQILTYARHSLSSSSEGSLAYRTYCNTGNLFIMVISEDPWHSHLLLSVKQWSCHYLVLRLRSLAAGSRTSYLPHARRKLLPTAPSPRRFCVKRGECLYISYVISNKIRYSRFHWIIYYWRIIAIEPILSWIPTERQSRRIFRWQNALGDTIKNHRTERPTLHRLQKQQFINQCLFQN